VIGGGGVRRSPGYTLAEALAGITLALIAGGSAVMSLASLVDGMRLAGGTRTVAASLRLARGRALAGEGPIEVGFDLGTDVFTVRDPAGSVLEAHSLPVGTVFASLPRRGHIRFGPLGTAENGTITLAAGSRVRQVVVNQRGRVRVP
jgi:Tfp pilus assembly protein FimT